MGKQGVSGKRKKGLRTLALLDDGALDAAEVARDVLNVRLALLVVPHRRPQRTGLLKVDCAASARVPIRHNEKITHAQ